MKNILITKIAAVLALSFFIGAVTHNHQVFAQQQELSYEKWGRVAIEKLKERYPNEEISDYLFAGSKKISEKEVVDTFLFVVIKNGKEVEVRVKISYNPKTNQVISSNIQEIS
ncbi:DUF3889 domain-containing protein [Lederbergia citri]|uniref:DUF3889 domain-containing protein n=1 Tax=Lederbergia citri TaxID=2833580 RepID=A0A942TH93_9BACI|nr:DUF3889 domain-containing protein [Lederbergia citri]MBS4196329.1 DUF3889 domain-containing protein [Lederbergia citri]